MDINSNLAQRQLIKRLVFEHKYCVAYKILSKILSQYPSDYEILSQIGYVSYKMQSYDESLTYYKQIIHINNIEIENSFISNWFNYHQYAKLLHLSKNDLYNAKKYYIKSLKLNNYNAPIYYDIANLYIHLKHYSESAVYFEQYFDLINENNSTYKIPANIDIDIVHYKYSQLLFYKLDRENNGKSQMEIAINLKPENISYQFEYALMLQHCSSFKKAKEYFLKCIEFTNYKNDKYLYTFGLFLTDHIKDTKNGMFYVKKALDLKPENVQYKNEYFALKNWNEFNYKKHNHDENNRQIYNWIKRDTRRTNFDHNSSNTIDWDKYNNNNRYSNSTILQFKRKFQIACQAQAEHNYVLAKNILQDLIKIAPHDGEIFGRYAFALAQLSRSSDINNLLSAEKYYKKSLQLSPRNYVTMYNYAFLLYYKLRRYDCAEILYKKCLSIKPNCAKALLNYARLLDTQKKHKLSEQYYRMCLSGSPNYDLCFYYFGCFLYRQQRYEEARFHLQKAVNCWPHSHLHHFRLAVTCHVLCQYQKAKFHLKQALRIKPDFIAAIEAYQRYGFKIQSNYSNNNNSINCNAKRKYKKKYDCDSNSDDKHLRMYDPIRRNHTLIAFDVDNDDRKCFINWLKSIYLYDKAKAVFTRNGIFTMKEFQAQITCKQGLIDMFDNELQIVNILWQSAALK